MSLFKEGYDIAIRAEATLYLILQLEEDGQTKDIKKREIGIEAERRDVRVYRLSRRNGVKTLGTRTVNKSANGRVPSKTATVVKRTYPSPLLRKRTPGLSPGPQPTAGGRAPPTGMNSTLGNAFRGCLKVNFGLDFNVGPDSELPGILKILDRNTKYSFFKETWTIWEVSRLSRAELELSLTNGWAIEMFWTPTVEETRGHRWIAPSRLRPAREAWFHA